MKLQYLGDSRDAFKWDLLHWLCTMSAREPMLLVFVPTLTPDDADLRDGKLPHHRFQARPMVLQIVAGLRVGDSDGLCGRADRSFGGQEEVGDEGTV